MTQPSEPAVEVAVQVLQYRRDVADRAVQVKVENLGDEAVTVDAVDLDAPGFAAGPRTPEDAVLDPGRRVDLRLPLGETECDASPDGAPVVRLWLNGAAEPVTHEVGDASALERVHQRECAEQAAREVLDVGFVPGEWQRAGEGDALVVHGVLRLEPRPGTAGALLAIEGSTLFAVTPAPPTRLPARITTATDVPVVLQPQRCDPHAVGESKRGYTFGVRVSLDGQDDVLLPVAPDAAGRSLLEDTLLTRCGLT